MKKIKISRPGYQIPLEKLLNVYRKELRSDILNSKPSKENLIIEKNKIFFNHIGYANCKRFFLFVLLIYSEADLVRKYTII